MSTATMPSRTVSWTRKLGKFSREYSSVIAIIILMVFLSIASPYFLTASNITNILLQCATVGIVTIGQALIITSGQFDLSVGQNACFTGALAAYLMKIVGLNPWLAILVALSAATLVGLTNGFLFAYFGIPAFIATLGAMNVCMGLAKIITNATPIANLPEEIAFLGRGYIGPIPFAAALMVSLFILMHFVTRRTKFGRDIYAVGGGREAAYFSGINVKLTYFLTFGLGGLMAGIGGIVLMSRLNSAAITNGYQYEFDSIIASVLGGISLAGGRGKLIGAMFGAIFLAMLFNGMTMLNVDPFYQDLLKGIVLIAAIGVDVLRNRARK